jgi:hypothetical protein
MLVRKVHRMAASCLPQGRRFRPDQPGRVLEIWEGLESILCAAWQNHLFVDNLQTREWHHCIFRAHAEEATYRQNGVGRLAARGYDHYHNVNGARTVRTMENGAETYWELDLSRFRLTHSATPA